MVKEVEVYALLIVGLVSSFVIDLACLSHLSLEAWEVHHPWILRKEEHLKNSYLSCSQRIQDDYSNTWVWIPSILTLDSLGLPDCCHSMWEDLHTSYQFQVAYSTVSFYGCFGVFDMVVFLIDEVDY